MNTRLLAQLLRTSDTFELAAKGEPGTCAIAPELAIAKTSTELLELPEARRNLPFAVTYMPAMFAYAANGEPGISVNVPDDGATAKT